MERVRPLKRFDNLYFEEWEEGDPPICEGTRKQKLAWAKKKNVPSWVVLSRTDWWQIGKTKTGKLVWYDYQSELGETYGDGRPWKYL